MFATLQGKTFQRRLEKTLKEILPSLLQDVLKGYAERTLTNVKEELPEVLRYQTYLISILNEHHNEVRESVAKST